MIYEIAREIVTRILRDKVLVGLIAILIFGSFFAGMQMKQEPGAEGTGDRANRDIQQPSSGQSHSQESDTLTPTLAADFVKWWLTSAMDYTAASAQQGHNQAFGWMTEEAKNSFKTAFWSPDIAQGIQNGKIIASFQAANIQPVAINPDGSIVVTVNGIFTYQTGGQPTTQQVQTDYLVRKEKAGLRIAGLYNRVAPVASASTN